MYPARQRTRKLLISNKTVKPGTIEDLYNVIVGRFDLHQDIDTSGSEEIISDLDRQLENEFYGVNRTFIKVISGSLNAVRYCVCNLFQ